MAKEIANSGYNSKKRQRSTRTKSSMPIIAERNQITTWSTSETASTWTSLCLQPAKDKESVLPLSKQTRIQLLLESQFKLT